MRAFVNGDELDLDLSSARIARLSDRLMVTTDEGTFSAVAIRQGDAVLISYKGNQFRVEERLSRTASKGRETSGEMRAPMPGQIVDVRKRAGDAVKKGDTVLVLEAMKTQQPFTAPFDGRVVKLEVERGMQVSDGQVLAVVEPIQAEP